MARAQLVTPEQVQQIKDLTVGTFDFDWDAVIVPLVTSTDGLETILPDGKLLVRPPPTPKFEAWFAGLQARLEAMDLRKVPRSR